MLEKIKKNKNEWHFQSLGMTILAIVVILKGHVEISFALMGISTVLMGIGALYNQNKEQGQKLDKILDNQKIIIYELLCKNNEDRKYEYTKDGATVMLNKAELINVLMKEENKNHQKAKDE